MIPVRLARELTYQLERAEEHERLARALSRIPLFLVLYQGEVQSEILQQWFKLGQFGYEPANHYDTAIEELKALNTPFYSMALILINGFYDSRGDWQDVVKSQTLLQRWSEDHKDIARAIEAHGSLGSAYFNLGEIEKAMDHINESLRLSHSINNARGIARSLGNLGNIHRLQGRYAEAIECFEKIIPLVRASGDKHTLGVALGNLGIVYWFLGRYSDAMSYFDQHYSIAEGIGDSIGMASACGNQGLVHWRMERFDEALSCYNRQLELATFLGAKGKMSNAIGNMGILYRGQGRYNDALKCYEQQLSISSSIGDKVGMSNALCSIGNIYCDLGHYSQAMEYYERWRSSAEWLGDRVAIYQAIGAMGIVCIEREEFDEAVAKFNEAIEGHLSVGSTNFVVHWQHGLGRAFLAMAERARNTENHAELEAHFLRQARENALNCEALSLQIQKPDMHFISRILLARIDAMEGKIEQADHSMQELLFEASSERHKSEVLFYRWVIQRSDLRKREALEACIQAFARFPSFEIQRRLAELKGEPIPKSADDLEELAA